MSIAPGRSEAGAATAPCGSPLRDWLGCMGSWLATPLRCRALRLVWIPTPVEAAGPIEAAGWTDDLEALQASTLEGDADDALQGGGPAGAGWLLPLDAGDSGVLCLFCASSLDPAQREAAVPALERAAVAVRAAWDLAAPCANQDLNLALVDREQLRRALHDFRNGLNSLLMNAATLSYRADALPEPLRRFASQLQRDGERCGSALHELEAMLEPARDSDSARKPS